MEQLYNGKHYYIYFFYTITVHNKNMMNTLYMTTTIQILGPILPSVLLLWLLSELLNPANKIYKGL